MSYFKDMRIGKNELGYDAWGRPKTITDHTLFHGLFTYDIPVSRWKEMNGTGGDISTMAEQSTITSGSSVNGMLNLVSDTTSGNIKAITSKRHARYQPNRGHLYSTSINIPTPNANGSAAFGIMNKENGVFFSVVGNGTTHSVYINIRRDGSIASQVDITSLLPSGFDITKGHVYDIQMQWRGVGNFNIFVDLELIYTFELSGTLSYLSVSNPALPATYTVQSGGDVYSLNSGCVDITSEGGTKEARTFASVNTGNSMVTTTNTPCAVLGYKIPDTYNGKVFTRDSIVSRMTSFCKDEAIHGVYMARAIDATNVAGLTWSQDPVSLNEYLVGGNSSDLDNAFTTDLAEFTEVYATRQEKDFSKAVNHINAGSELVLSAGDIIIVSLRSDSSSSLGGATLEFAVEI